MAEPGLNPTQRRYLKQLAHPLKPLLQIGKEGCSQAFLAQLLEQLGVHELIKIRILNNCMASPEAIREALIQADIALVQKVGHVLTVYKKNEENPKIPMPKS